jgi:hypothetical protein
MGTTRAAWLIASASVVTTRTTIIVARCAISACGTVSACGTIATVTTVATITSIAAIFLGELLCHRFEWLVVSDQGDFFNFVNFDAALGDADDRDAINVELSFGFDNISGL